MKTTLILLLCSQLAYSQIINIPDPAFKAHLTSIFQYIDTNSDGEIDKSEANTVFTLVLDDLGITDLTGLEEFDSLVNFIIQDNMVKSIDISHCSKLANLYCRFEDSLEFLSVRNGNNINYSPSAWTMLDNPNLICIQVDDPAFAFANWSTRKDSWAFYSNECLLGIKEKQIDWSGEYDYILNLTGQVVTRPLENGIYIAVKNGRAKKLPIQR